jgi:hypothetical protein
MASRMTTRTHEDWLIFIRYEVFFNIGSGLRDSTLVQRVMSRLQKVNIRFTLFA